MSDTAETTVRPMNSGSNLHSYTKNSTVQRQIIEATKEFITKAVEKLDIKTFLPSKTIRIADFGCATGPNTFLAVETIIDSLENKFCKPKEITLDFQVFFNDLSSNDFNQLFLALPPNKRYFAAGVPGSFHGPLFPKDSLHFVYSSFGVHWLSRVPEEVTDKSSPAWNKGKIYYSNSTEEVARAYEAQFGKDMDSFFKFRAQEIVDGGLMAFVIGGRSNRTPHSGAKINKGYELVGYALADMAKEGKISDAKLDSFNIPLYHASLEEVESAVKRSGSFSIETMDSINVSIAVPSPNFAIATLRAVLEGIIEDHFGKTISDELFGTFLGKKIFEFSPSTDQSSELINILAVLKRVKNNE